MPRPFDVSTPSSATVGQVHAAFTDQSYWRDRLAEFGGDSIRLDSLDVDERGTVHVKTTQDMRKDALPGLIAKAIPGDLKVVREETWRLVGAELHADVAIHTSGAPISGVATARVSPATGGSVLRFTGTVQVRVPLIGGQVEKYISSQISEEIPGVQRFTTRWVAENG